MQGADVPWDLDGFLKNKTKQKGLRAACKRLCKQRSRAWTLSCGQWKAIGIFKTEQVIGSNLFFKDNSDNRAHTVFTKQSIKNIM